MATLRQIIKDAIIEYDQYSQEIKRVDYPNIDEYNLALDELIDNAVDGAMSRIEKK